MSTKKLRKGPSESATQFSVGTKKQGNDGNMWEIIKASNGVKRWKKQSNMNTRRRKQKQKTSKKKDHSVSMSNGQTYFTHSNGSRPFMVVVNKTSVYVHKLPDNLDIYHIPTKKDYTILVTTFKNVKKVYIGNSIKGDDANGNKKYGKGNSILLHLSGKKYGFIGSSVFTFEIEKDDEFENFYSAIGRNDIPYPLVLGKKNIYFMLREKSYIHYLSRDITEFEDFPKKHSWALNAYNVFYGDSSFDETFSMKKIEKKYKKVKSLKQIHGYIF